MSAAGSDFISFYKDAYSTFDLEHRTSGSLPVDMLLSDQDSHETHDVYGDNLVVSSSVQAKVDRAWLQAGDGRSDFGCAPGTTIVHPPGTEALFHVEGPHRILVLSVRQRAVEALLDQFDGPPVSTLDSIAFEEFSDPMIFRAMQQMWCDSQTLGAASALVVDGLFHMLLGRLLQRAGRGPEPAPASFGATQVTRVMEIIEAELGGRITTEMLAREAGVSQFHFARLFKRATGTTPHAYLTERRLARAKEKLVEGDLSIAQIAYVCGFASQSHMTAAFSRHVGITPAVYRRDKRSTPD